MKTTIIIFATLLTIILLILLFLTSLLICNFSLKIWKATDLTFILV